MPIIAGGIGSGLDINGIVSQLVAAEAEPANARLNAKEIDLGSELSAFGTLKSALSAFQTSVTRLEDESAFQVFTANSSDEDVFTASADKTAVAGSYNIEVIQLAQAEKLRSKNYSASTDIVGTGTANPVATILSVALLFEHAGAEAAARKVEEAVNASLAAGVRTPDAGGTATTSEAGTWIADYVAGG